jgi:transcriptional regulator with XRE-family HTH domain
MPPRQPDCTDILIQRLKAFREAVGMSVNEAERTLLLGPGWISRIERGESIPSIDLMLAILKLYRKGPVDAFSGILEEHLPSNAKRSIAAESDGNDLLIRFAYSHHDAVHKLPSASIEQFHDVVQTLRDGLAGESPIENSTISLQGTNTPLEIQETADASPAKNGADRAVKTEAVASAFLKAVSLWPHINPSDIWWFLISRLYCDPLNHPASAARLDFGQSWKRTGGWALERIIQRHYGPFLQSHGVRMLIPQKEEKQELAAQFTASGVELIPDKIDVFLAGDRGDKLEVFGVVHVKASFAERRTDDVPMSEALCRAGFLSPLWTMDCKSMPGVNPINHGELGGVLEDGQPDRRSDKRKDIEERGLFSGCFSYNHRTRPTPEGQRVLARVHVCDFQNPDDAFSRFILADWHRRQST